MAFKLSLENCQIIFNHFSNIFSKGGPTSQERCTCFDLIGRAIPTSVPQNMIPMLDQDITINEIYMAIDSLKDNKSLGVDGL